LVGVGRRKKTKAEWGGLKKECGFAGTDGVGGAKKKSLDDCWGEKITEKNWGLGIRAEAGEELQGEAESTVSAISRWGRP